MISVPLVSNHKFPFFFEPTALHQTMTSWAGYGRLSCPVLPPSILVKWFASQVMPCASFPMNFDTQIAQTFGDNNKHEGQTLGFQESLILIVLIKQHYVQMIVALGNRYSKATAPAPPMGWLSLSPCQTSCAVVFFWNKHKRAVW